MSKKINTLASGNIVKLNENGVPKKYLFLGYNHYGKGEVTLLRKDALGGRAWAPSGQSSYNIYNGCDIDTFCNEQHIQCLDPVIKACLINVPIPTVKGAIAGTFVSTVETLYRKGFLLSCTEVGLSGAGVEGSAFAYFSSDANRITYHDETTTAVNWWLRSPYSGYTNYAYRVSANGSLYNYNVCSAYNCPRPALALSSEILVSDSVDGDGCYTIVSAPAGEEYMKINGVWMKMV
ncbi:MAG: DUF6273 domain-containing protein [Prevotella sp.]